MRCLNTLHSCGWGYGSTFIMSYIYEVFEHLTQLWMGIWQHIHTVTITEISPDLGELAEILDDVSVEVIPLRYR